MAAHRLVGRLFGKGEYRASFASEHGVEPEEVAMPDTSPEVNSLVKPLSTSQLVPIMGSGKEGRTIVRKREFVRTVNIGTTPQVYGWGINPGRLAAFPWAHAMARNFQSFRFLGLAAEYVPTSGLALTGTNAALGQVILAFQYNVVYQTGVLWPTTSDQGMLNMDGAMSCSPAAHGTCPMECKEELDAQNMRFVYTEDPTTVQAHSLQNFDSAWLAIRTSGGQDVASYQAGQIWVTYEVELLHPTPQDPAFSLTPGRYADVISAWKLIESYTGPYSEDQVFQVAVKKSELQAVMREPDFQRWLLIELARQARAREQLEDQPGMPKELVDLLPDIFSLAQPKLARCDVQYAQTGGGFVTSGYPCAQ
jgi:hypothetical protein